MLKTVRIINHLAVDKSIALSSGYWVIPAGGAATVSLFDYITRLTPTGGSWPASGRLDDLVVEQQQEIGDSLNVKRFGAVGNGAVDDTEAIQRALDAAYKSGGGDVYFPAGIYKVGNLVVRDNVEITGGGHAAVIDGNIVVSGSGCGLRDVRVGAGV